MSQETVPARGNPHPSPACYTFSMKRLIVNADDFGLTHGVNRAIAECHRHGIVTSATLMATGLLWTKRRHWPGKCRD